MKLVLDTNIFIAAIIKDSSVRHLIIKSPLPLLFPEVILTEIDKHTPELLKKSKLSPADFEKVKSVLLEYVEVIPTSTIKPYARKAAQIISEIDPNDAAFIATCLAYNATLWSDDKDLKKQNEVAVLNTKEIITLFENK